MSKRTDPKKIYLGSGKAYIMEFTGTLPETTAICTDTNLLGLIQGGAQLTYTTEQHFERDDLGLVEKVVINAEEALLKLGLITFNGQTLAKLADRCQVTEDKTKGLRTVKIGGSGNAQGKDWVVCFHHPDTTDGDVWLLVRGSNQAGLALAYAMDAGTKLEPEIKALPSDDKGTLITYIEEIGKSTT